MRALRMNEGVTSLHGVTTSPRREKAGLLGRPRCVSPLWGMMSRSDQSGELFEIAVEAYTYLYPLVIMDVTRRQATNAEVGKFPGRGRSRCLVTLRRPSPRRL